VIQEELTGYGIIRSLALQAAITQSLTISEPSAGTELALVFIKRRPTLVPPLVSTSLFS
jgi:hypothetical protein